MTNAWAARLNKSPTTQTDEIKSAVRHAIAGNDLADSMVDLHIPPEALEPDDERVADSRKLSKLVDDDFPFDESQLAAINGMIHQDYACLTGAAGTGKTTTTKKLVDELQNLISIRQINMKEYFKCGEPTESDDDYHIPDSFIPAIALVSFTGRATQQIKKNFPRDWHGNIMTIHRLLAFVPEYFEAYDDSTDEWKSKMRFAPTYTADVQLPWDIIIIDEAGMTGLDLWHQLWAACKPGCRIYMIGDINQLPPVHGRSIFGFAMAKWPSFELHHIHRQQGTHNAIVDNAWRVLNGEMPISEGRFQMLELKGDHNLSSRQIRKLIPALQQKEIYDPIRDTIITPINGNEGSRGYSLGQLPLNREFAMIFNPQSIHPRYIIDAGRGERRQFAVGDKVMATKNDHEAGITNGMTGLIIEITENAGYGGDHRRFGTVESVNAYLRETEEDLADTQDFSLESLQEDFQAVEEGKEAAKESRDRGPSSHTVSVRFGDDEHGFELPFQSLSEVSSLMTAYVVTCHKMQGGESPVIIIICHDAHRQMLYREWLYTAITRASQKCILLYSQTALRSAINKQNIKGRTLAEKIQSFNDLQKNNGLGVALKVQLPEPEGDEPPPPEPPQGTGLSVIDPAPIPIPHATKVTERVNPLFGKFKIKVTVEHVHTIHHSFDAEPEAGASLEPTAKPEPSAAIQTLASPPSPASVPLGKPTPPRLLNYTSPKLLTYQPQEPTASPVSEVAVEPKAKPANAWAAKMAKKEI